MKSKDTPLAELTLRKYERPYKIGGRDLVTKLCLSVGLLQPGDSRDVIVDVLYVLLKNDKLNSQEIVKEVISFRKKKKLQMLGIAPSNIRRQVRRLRELFIVEKIANDYRINEKEKLVNIYKEKIEEFLLKSIKERVEEYFATVDKEFLEKRGKKKRKKKRKKK